MCVCVCVCVCVAVLALRAFEWKPGLSKPFTASHHESMTSDHAQNNNKDAVRSTQQYNTITHTCRQCQDTDDIIKLEPVKHNTQAAELG